MGVKLLVWIIAKQHAQALVLLDALVDALRVVVTLAWGLVRENALQPVLVVVRADVAIPALLLVPEPVLQVVAQSVQHHVRMIAPRLVQDYVKVDAPQVVGLTVPEDA
jgi:hypothetical protein